MNKYEIKIEDFTRERVLVGGSRGNKLREQLNIDHIYSSYDEIEFIFPSNTLATNSSFFEGLFQDIIFKLGQDKFLDKFKFIGYDCDIDIAEAIYNVDREKKYNKK
ncbi:MAG: hypothetical protein SLAVMIC_00699 [uncultured marine phage]|uniref:DUF4325 domain-containing protein n=1 Tax=uncultured marine phage TaxID=707152 RepID=A0A8D9CC01_9VIRU|nr:MAG: hypothetical protein SLAVMIC_00699 [uncultured marine phage]